MKTDSIRSCPSVWNWQTNKHAHCLVKDFSMISKAKWRGKGGEGKPTVWEGYDMVTSKQTNKHLSSYIVSHILKLWISMDCCLHFISSLAYPLLEFQTLGQSLAHTAPPYLGLHQGLPLTTYRVNYSPIPTHKHEQVDYTMYRVNYSPIPTTHKHEQVDYTTCRVNYSHPQTWTSWLYEARYYFNDTTQNCWPIKNN
jgi:hypothetical protein